jgi:phenylalanine-4-hydroxylase
VFQEGQYFAPVVVSPDGGVEVQLGAGHPGVRDEAYRERRNALAALALAWRPGDPLPTASYTQDEHEVWRLVSRELAAKHQRDAGAEFLAGSARVQLPADRIPQLDEVTAALGPLTGFRYVPAAGLVPLRQFYGCLAEGIFHSTQYIRHHTVPFYTPEPDVLHEVVGHANCLASPRFAALYRLAGQAAQRVQSTAALEFVSKVFWFTLEFGVVYEHGELRTYGAGILSSYGELEEFGSVAIRPLDVAAMGSTTYDITAYQPMLYAAESFSHVEDVIGEFFETCDDATIAEISSIDRADHLTALG